MADAVGLIGMRFDRLMVIDRAGSNAKRHALWRCRCDCGRVVTVAGYNLRRPDAPTRSCGCLRSENAVRQSLRRAGKDVAQCYFELRETSGDGS